MAQNVYSTCSLPYSTGCFLYTDSGLTTPAANGIYSDGTNTYTVTGGAGEITSVSTCAAASTTTSTTTTTTTVAACLCYTITNNTGGTANYTYTPCGSGTPTVVAISDGTTDNVCSETLPTSVSGLIIAACTDVTTCVDNTDCFGCTASTTTTSTTTTTTAAPTTTSTTTTTTAAPTTTSTTTTTTLFTNLTFDLTTGVGGYTIGGIDVNAVIPTLTGGTDVPFSTDTHDYNTNQIGTNETLNIFVSALSLNGCITVTDSASNVFQQNINATGTYSFTGLTIDNTTAVLVLCADNAC